MHTTILALPQPNPPAGDEPQAPGLTNFLPFLLILVVIMLFMPLFSRKEKKRQKRIVDLKKHDRVVTSGGIYGTIVTVDEQTVTLEVSKGVRMTFKRSSVYDLEKPGEAQEKGAPDKAAAKNA